METSRRLAGFLPRALALGASALVSTALLHVQVAAAASAQATTTDTGTAAQINASHAGVVAHDTLTPPLALAWNINLGGSASYPLVDNGRVFVTAMNSNGSVPQLWALNQQTGATLWGPVMLSGPGWANATLDNGRIFVEDANGFLQAFDENGNRIWGTQLTGSYFSAPPTAASGIVYTSSADSGLATGRLYAIRESDGATLWRAPIIDGEYSSPVVSSSGVYVSYACAQTYDFNPTTGALIWQHPAASCSTYGGTTPVLANGKLYVRDATAGNLILDASSGASLGTFIGTVTPAISGTRGFFKDQSAVYGYDLSSNTRLWAFYGDGTLTSAPIMVGSYLYVASHAGTVYALDPQTGAQVWTASTPFVCCMNGPNEQNNSQPLTGLGAGYGMLFEPTGYNLLAFGGQETLYPGDANWGYQLTGQPTVPAAPFTLTSNSPNGLIISSISTSGDYSQTNTCRVTLSFGSSCVIGVTFTPSWTGSRVGTLVITDNAAGSPHVVQLSGIGAPSGTSPNHLVLSPAGAIVPVGGSQTYRAELLDQNNTDLADVTAGTTFELDGISCGGASCSTTAAGSHTVTGVYQGATGTATLTVGSSPLDHLTVTPAAATVVAGASQSYVVEGFDAAGSDLGNVTTASTLSISPDGSCNGAICSATAAGSHTVTAVASGKTAFAQLTVSAGSLDHITLDPSSLTVTAGTSFGFNTAAVDQYGNVLSDVSQFTALSISPDGACPGRGCLADVPGPHTVTANYQGKSTTASVTVTPNSPYRIVVTPGSATVTAGTPQTYHVEAYDGVSNDLGDVTTSTTLSVDGSASACVGSSCSTTIPGQHKVGAIYQGLTATASLTVNAGPVAYTTITPSSITTTAGSSFGFATQAYDQYGNFLGDVSQSTALSITPDGACSGPGCLADIPGPHTVTANYQGFVHTVPVTITPGALYRITLTPSSSTIVAGASQTYEAEGFDGVGNDLGSVTSVSAFMISPDGSCTGATCLATQTGPHSIRVSLNSISSTAPLTVNPGAASRIRLAPTSAAIPAGGSQAFTARTVDAYENMIADVTSATAFALSPNGTCSANVCTAPTQATTNANVTGTYNGMTDLVNLVVSPGPLDHITVSPASSSMTAGQTQTYSDLAYDQYSNPVGAGNVTSASTYAIVPDGSCSGATCTATKSGPHTVTATYQGKTASAVLTLNPGVAATLTLTPATAAIVAGGSQGYAVEGFDSYGNDLGTLTANSSFAIAPDGSCANVACTATKAGPHTVTATYQGKTATSSLAVNSGPARALAVSPASLTLTVGQSAALTASATDAYGNVVGAGTATWAVSSGTPGKITSTTGTTTTFTATANTAGTGTIVAHLGALTAQSAARVLPAAPKALTAIVEGHEVSLSWTAAAGDRTYAVYRKTGTGAWALIKTGLTATSFSDSGLTGGTAYKYYVTGRAVGLESVASNTVSIIAK